MNTPLSQRNITWPTVLFSPDVRLYVSKHEPAGWYECIHNPELSITKRTGSEQGQVKMIHTPMITHTYAGKLNQPQ